VGRDEQRTVVRDLNRHEQFDVEVNVFTHDLACRKIINKCSYCFVEL
jgi:hypothetical protein